MCLKDSDAHRRFAPENGPGAAPDGGPFITHAQCHVQLIRWIRTTERNLWLCDTCKTSSFKNLVQPDTRKGRSARGYIVSQPGAAGNQPDDYRSKGDSEAFYPFQRRGMLSLLIIRKTPGCGGAGSRRRSLYYSVLRTNLTGRPELPH